MDKLQQSFNNSGGYIGGTDSMMSMYQSNGLDGARRTICSAEENIVSRPSTSFLSQRSSSEGFRRVSSLITGTITSSWASIRLICQPLRGKPRWLRCPSDGFIHCL